MNLICVVIQVNSLHKKYLNLSVAYSNQHWNKSIFEQKGGNILVNYIETFWLIVSGNAASFWLSRCSVSCEFVISSALIPLYRSAYSRAHGRASAESSVATSDLTTCQIRPEFVAQLMSKQYNAMLSQCTENFIYPTAWLQNNVQRPNALALAQCIWIYAYLHFVMDFYSMYVRYKCMGVRIS